MRILYVTLENLSLHKGSVVHVKEIVTGLKDLGHQVGLVASAWGKTNEADHFYNLHRLPNFLMRLLKLKRQPNAISALFLFLYLFKILLQYDLVYARDYHATILATIPRHIFRKKLIYEINGLAHEEQLLKKDSWSNRLLSSFIRNAEKRAAKYADRIVSVTPQIAQYLVQHFSCQASKIEIISNGVNTKKFYPIEDRNMLLQIKTKYNILCEGKIIIFVGNLAPWQGVELLIQVAPLVVKEIPDLKFLIIGNGMLRQEFETEVNRLGLSSYFVFTGMIDYRQIPYYINVADICVLPKRGLTSGYSPIKLYEYMACGKPIVATRVQGLEFIEAEGSGRLIEPGDSVSLGVALIELLKNDERRKMMGRKGSQIARERFSWASRAAKIEKMMLELA